MSVRRIIYLNWMAELGSDPDLLRGKNIWSEAFSDPDAPDDSLNDLKQKVQAAIDCLDEDERYLIIRRFFLGQSITEIARQSGRARHRLFSLQRRAMKKLKKRLAKYVEARFRIQSTLSIDCPLCNSPFRHEIDSLIAKRDPSRSWRPVIRILNERYFIRITTPMTLIGHERYH